MPNVKIHMLNKIPTSSWDISGIFHKIMELDCRGELKGQRLKLNIHMITAFE
jgi:hypothetical protein